MRALLTLCVLAFAAAAAFAKAPPEEWDGLHLTKVKGIQYAYVRPGASMAGYSKVMLDPVQVSFSKDWDPDRPGTRFPISQEERDRIKQGLADLFMKTFTETLSKDNGYPVVSDPAPDVMRVSAALIDVYVNAPDVPTAGRTRSYTTNAGRMTLVAELRDSETGSLFARVVDGEQARDNTYLTWTTSVENVSEARAVIGKWAKILRDRMDAVRQHMQQGATGESPADPDRPAARVAGAQPLSGRLAR